MGINKNALIRYKILDRCFRNPGKKYFINDLIEECDKVLLDIDPDSNGISRRQILEDIKFMESRDGWAIELTRRRIGKKVFYRYADLDFSINNMPLNDMEINQLQSVADVLSQFSGMPQFEWINELVPKLRQGMATSEAADAIIGFDSNEFLRGIEHLTPLHNAIVFKKILRISYQPFGTGTPTDVIIHPYFLKQYNNRWFLFGFNPENQKYNWNLAIDRIYDIKDISGKYHKNTKINWLDYFDDMIGVTRTDDSKVESIILNFYGKTCKYIESKPLHGSQKSRWIERKYA